jgi:vacuolar-type H+-ATPase subunit H
MKVIHNCETGEIVTLPYSAEELAQREIDQAEYLAKQAIYEANEAEREAQKNAIRAKLVAGEPLTEEEAQLIVI